MKMLCCRAQLFSILIYYSMKRLILATVFIFLLASIFGQENPSYDSSLATSLGADEYGMKMYVMVLLKTGGNPLNDGAKLDSIIRGHLDNIGRLADSGKLIIAGPFEENDKTYEGIFIFNVRTFKEAQELLETDPAIKEKLLSAELYHWYGSAALPEYLKVHKMIEKRKP